MVKKILMPSLSPTMNVGNIKKWSAVEGEKVCIGDILVEIETDKSTMEVESLYDGTIYKILLPNNSSEINVNTVIAILKEDNDAEEDLINILKTLENEDVASSDGNTGAIVQDEESEIKNDTHNSDVNRVKDRCLDMDNKSCKNAPASPIAKRIAREKGIDINVIKGTGIGGRIVKTDVSKYMDKEVNQVLSNEVKLNDGSSNRIIEMSNMRKIIAQKLSESKREIPHFYLTFEASMGSLKASREQLNESSVEKKNKVTVNDFIIKAVAMSLEEFPELNCYFDNNKIVYNDSINISIAVSLESGLVVPVVRDVNKRSLFAISSEIKSLVKKAHDSKLIPTDSVGGSMTVSNLGMYNIDSFYAIINPPQSSILAVGCTKKRPYIVNDDIVIGDFCTFSLSVDHRLVDGVLAAKFVAKLKSLIENPVKMLAH